MTDQIKRQVALKCTIAEIAQGTYVREEGWKPNYVQTRTGKHISRVNIIATILSNSGGELNYQSIVIDDGTAKIEVRSFDENENFKSLDVGGVMLLVGRPREFGNQKYIIPELIKKIENNSWVRLRRLELSKETGTDIPPVNAEEQSVIFSEPMSVEVVRDVFEDVHQDVVSVIRKNDTGDGAEMEKVIKQLSRSDAEKIISDLLKEGEICEISPGRIKVLE